MTEHESVLNILIPLLRHAIFSHPCEISNDSLTPEMTEKLYRCSTSHDIAHIVGKALDSLKLLDNSSEYLEKFRKQQLVAFYRYERMICEAEQIYSLLEKHKIPYIPLKGAVIRKLYPESWMRTSCDIDVLIHECNLKAAVNALKSELAYKVSSPRNYHDISLLSESGIRLELHFNILENTKSIDKLLRRVWDFAVRDEGYEFRHKLTNEFLAFHTVAHMSYHFVSGGCGIRSLIDFKLVSDKLDADPDKLHAMCAECKLENFFDALTKLCRAWFEDSECDSVCKELQSFIVRGGAYGTLDNKLAMQNAQKGSSFKYLTSRIFGSYDMMKERYPTLRKHKYLMPFCQMHRLASSLTRGTFKHSLSEAKKNAKLSKEDKNSAEKLLKALGLYE